MVQEQALVERLLDTTDARSFPSVGTIPSIQEAAVGVTSALTTARSFDGNMFTMFRQYTPDASGDGQFSIAVFDTQQIRTSTCKASCCCNCHRRTMLSTPAFLSGLIGSLLVGYIGLPFPPRPCNERTCQGHQHGSAQLTYLFPRWLVPRLISVTYSQKAGIGVVLKAPRIISDDALVLRYAAIGDIENMKLLFSKGLASPHDVGASYGMTPLHVSYALRITSWNLPLYEI